MSGECDTKKRQELLKMAEAAGAKFDPHWGIAYNCGTETFVRFAEAVSAAKGVREMDTNAPRSITEPRCAASALSAGLESMIKEAGWAGIYTQWSSATERSIMTVPVTPEQVAKFAELVAAADREACAALLEYAKETLSSLESHRNMLSEELRRLYEALESTYSLSPEGRAELERMEKALNYDV